MQHIWMGHVAHTKEARYTGKYVCEREGGGGGRQIQREKRTICVFVCVPLYVYIDVIYLCIVFTGMRGVV